ncbi:MAG TPA: hypothetical protein VJW94_16855 [Candidatus Acidoferrum sp.]|nr:hypothetical protein [Candidatus Acidoferrum sp.]
MRSMRFVVLSAVFLAAALLLTTPSKAQSSEDDSSGPRGSVPRSSASRYHSHTQSDGTSVGADILTPKQVQKAFVADLNRCCIVVEFAFYPSKEKVPHDLSLDDFALYLSGSDIGTKPQSATLVAASLQKKAGSGPPVSVHGGATVGYESGTSTDPNTGLPIRVHGVYTGTEIDVSDAKPAPGSTARDRQIMETELSQKGLPEGKAAAPVSGYLYFSIHNRKKDAKYKLEYNFNGEKLILPLP